MSEHEERPLRLEQLADVESPDVMRAALQRFRRRTLVRGILAILAVVALPATLRGLNENEDSFQVKLARAQSHQIGRVLRQDGLAVSVLEVRRLQDADMEEELQGQPPPPPFAKGNRLLHLVVTASNIRNDETLATSPFTLGGPGENTEDAQRGERAVEVWLALGRGQDEIEFDVAALTGLAGGERGPGMHSTEECAVPLNPLGVCEFLKIEGRIIGHVSIDLDALGVPKQILE